MNQRMHEAIFAGAVILYVIAFAVCANAQPKNRKPETIRIEYRQCETQVMDFDVVYNPDQKICRKISQTFAVAEPAGRSEE